MSSQTDTTSSHAAPRFASIICGVDGSGPSREAARQAALLAGDASLTFVAVSWEQGIGTSAAVTLSRGGAQSCLHRVRADTAGLGVGSVIVEEQSPDPAGRLMALAAGHDLLVVGIHGHSRAGGIITGSTASAVLHRSPVPVLVARRPPDDVAFPSRILLASDGTPLSDSAARLTARLAARHHASVAIIGARDHDAPFKPGLVEHATQIREATGADPVFVIEAGPPHRAVAAAAREFGAALVVTGSRGMTGVAALQSVSERTAHAVPCSVLVMRPRA
jgi:nucleotide-binding universal stress UspA family protein